MITLGVGGYLAVWLIALPEFRRVLDEVPTAFLAWNTLAGMSALGLFVGWGLGIYHWGTRYTGKRKALWGVAVIPGAFLGAFAYWWFAAGMRSQPEAAHPVAEHPGEARHLA